MYMYVMGVAIYHLLQSAGICLCTEYNYGSYNSMISSMNTSDTQGPNSEWFNSKKGKALHLKVHVNRHLPSLTIY